MPHPVRRVVTGLNENGRARVLIDSPSPHVMDSGASAEKTNRRSFTRLTSAWGDCCDIVQIKKEKRASSAPIADWDDVIDDGEGKRLKQAFPVVYLIRIDAYLHPNDRVLGRLLARRHTRPDLDPIGNQDPF